jgi:hypothetical protein
VLLTVLARSYFPKERQTDRQTCQENSCFKAKAIEPKQGHNAGGYTERKKKLVAISLLGSSQMPIPTLL